MTFIELASPWLFPHSRNGLISAVVNFKSAWLFPVPPSLNHLSVSICCSLSFTTLSLLLQVAARNLSLLVLLSIRRVVSTFECLLYSLFTSPLNMWLANCCTSRGTPSPDGQAPRPVPETHEPRQGKTPQTCLPSLSATSRLSKPEDIADLQAIFESDKSSTESEHRCVKNKESSNTLKAIRKRLGIHLSIDSGVSKRLSRSSVGTSEEEIERRAELRRIRQKRIQEELSSEGIYDEDAKSLPSAIVAGSSSSLANEAPWSQGRPCSFPSLTSPPRSRSNIALLKPDLPPLELSPLELEPLEPEPQNQPLQHVHTSNE